MALFWERAKLLLTCITHPELPRSPLLPWFPEWEVLHLENLFQPACYLSLGVQFLHLEILIQPVRNLSLGVQFQHLEILIQPAHRLFLGVRLPLREVLFQLARHLLIMSAPG